MTNTAVSYTHLVPTSIATNAVFGHRAGVRFNSVVKYVGYVEPVAVYVDYGIIPVSYTHLDVYKRQVIQSAMKISAILSKTAVRSPRKFCIKFPSLCVPACPRM